MMQSQHARLHEMFDVLKMFNLYQIRQLAEDASHTISGCICSKDAPAQFKILTTSILFGPTFDDEPITCQYLSWGKNNRFYVKKTPNEILQFDKWAVASSRPLGRG